VLDVFGFEDEGIGATAVTEGVTAGDGFAGVGIGAAGWVGDHDGFGGVEGWVIAH
jgi:hypothetical protein